MQSVSSRIWTRVAKSISYDDNDYTTGTSLYINHYTSIFLLEMYQTFRNSPQENKHYISVTYFKKKKVSKFEQKVTKIGLYIYNCIFYKRKSGLPTGYLLMWSLHASTLDFKNRVHLNL